MRSVPNPFSSDRSREPIGRRITAFLLVLIVHILGGIMLFMLAPPQSALRKAVPTLALLSLSEPQVAHKPAQHSVVARQKHTAGGGAPKSHAPPNIPPPAKPLDMVIMNSDVFAASNIAGLPHHEAPAGGGEGGTGSGKQAGAAYGPGEGPGGSQLFNAEWYVEPTEAQLAYYLPPAARQQPDWKGIGSIACRTIPDYHVEDCRELGETPPGIGLSRAMRQAAWQFRVRPPRVDGRPLMGAWVRITYYFNEPMPK